MQPNQARAINQTYCIDESILLGKGSTGNVYLGFERNSPYNRVAIKAIDLKTIDNQVTRYLLSCEIAALSNLGKLVNTGHQNIVRLYDIVLQDHFIFLIMEHLEGGTLADYIKKHPQGLNQNEALFIFRQILEGYAHMKNKQIVHRDLKPDNILFKTDPEKSKKVAIIDFGYCEMEQVPNKPQLYYNVGSPKYMSPEAYKENHYSQKSDIWALGVIFYEMLAGKTCDHGMSMEKYLEMIEKQGIPLPAKINPFNRHILCIMLSYLHNNRLSADQILRQIDSYLNGLNHQRSEVLLRTNFSEGQNKPNIDNINVRPNKNSSVFQSLILPSNNLGARSSLRQNPTNAWNRNEYVFQRKLAPGNRAPIIQINTKPVLQTRYFLQQENIEKVQNVQFGSVRDIIHRRPNQNDEKTLGQFAETKNSFINSSYILPNQNIEANTQTTPNFFNKNLNLSTFIDPKTQIGVKIQSHLNSAPMANNNNLVKRIHFVNNFSQNPFPPPGIKPAQLHNIGTPSSNGIKIKINNPSPILHIQQQKKIQIDQINQNRYHSPEKQPVTVASNVLFFTEKKNNLPEAPQSPSKPQRPIINLKPSYTNGQIKVGFTKLQPQRALKFNQNQLQNPLSFVKQGFCV